MGPQKHNLTRPPGFTRQVDAGSVSTSSNGLGPSSTFNIRSWNNSPLHEVLSFCQQLSPGFTLPASGLRRKGNSISEVVYMKRLKWVSVAVLLVGVMAIGFAGVAQQ